MTDAAATRWSWFNARHAVAAIVLVYVPMLPALLLNPLGLKAAIGPFLFGAMASMLAAILIRPSFALAVAGLVALFNLAAIPAASSIVGASAVMGLAALVYGITARRGINAVLMMAPISVAFTLADPPVVFEGGTTLANAAIVGVTALIGGLWGVLVGAVLRRKASLPAPAGVPLAVAIKFAVIIAIVSAATMAVVVSQQLQHSGAWIVLTVILLIQPDFHATWQRTGHRIVGTLLGFGIALAIGLIVRQAPVELLIGMLLLTVAVYLKLDSTRPYWQFVAFLTPGIVLAEGAGERVLATDIARLWSTLVGAAIAIAVLVIAKILVKDSGSSAGASEDVSVAQKP
ncbi:MAG: hypothetical protein RL134_1750 [Actinomycetota bacterium]|jgi:hypothetical protein